MSQQTALEFIKVGAKSPKIQEQLRPLDVRKEADQKKLLDIAAKEGYRFTMDEWQSAIRSAVGDQPGVSKKSGELSEAELDATAGGKMCAESCFLESGCGNSWSMFC